MRDVLLTADELGERWRLSPQTLANLRSAGKGPPFVKLSNGSIRYKLSDILKAETDGRHGFSWEKADEALKHLDWLSPQQRAELIEHLRRSINPQDRAADSWDKVIRVRVIPPGESLARRVSRFFRRMLKSGG
jgi:hypothetical protein